MTPALSSTPNWPKSWPIVGVACLIFFLGYVFLATGFQGVHCQRSLAAVQCESLRTGFFGLVPYAKQPFVGEGVEVVSELTDRVPRGGVRFHHTLKLSSPQGVITTEVFQSPVSGAALKKQVQDFLGGNGPQDLVFQVGSLGPALARSGLMAGLLLVVTWGFWDVRWP